MALTALELIAATDTPTVPSSTATDRYRFSSALTLLSLFTSDNFQQAVEVENFSERMTVFIARLRVSEEMNVLVFSVVVLNVRCIAPLRHLFSAPVKTACLHRDIPATTFDS